MLYALIALCLFGSASAQLIEGWGCPGAVYPMMDFDPSKLKGRWYKVRKFPMVYTWLSHCPAAEFEWTGYKIRIRNRTLYSKQRIRLTFGGEAWHSIDKAAGGFESTAILENWKIDYSVLATDYEKYLVIYSCTSFFILHVTFLFIYTKKPDPPNNVLVTAERVLDGNKISRKYLQTVDRANCSEVDRP